MLQNGAIKVFAIDVGYGQLDWKLRTDARVINMATIKPLDKDIVIQAAEDCGKIVTVEEHNIIGGLGEAVCAVLAENCPVPVHRIGVNDEFGHSGPAAELLKQFGLTSEHIVAHTKKLISK